MFKLCDSTLQLLCLPGLRVKSTTYPPYELLCNLITNRFIFSSLIRPSRKLRCCDRTNSREFSDCPRIQRDVAILTHHRNFPANLTNYCRLPQLSPFRYTKGRNSALWTRSVT